jgi:Putative Ig domain/Cep192 domain 4
MLRVRLAAVTAVASAVVLTAGGGTALASHGGTSGGGGGTTTTTSPPPPTSTPTISISPSTVTFPSQDVGTTSPAQTVTVTNTGASSVFFNAETQDGANAVDFLDLNSQCVGVTIAPGASCALTLQFRPSATGTRTGTIALTDNAAGSPQIINLTGTGTSTAGPTPMTVDTSGLSCTAGVCGLGDTIANNFYFSQMGVQGDTTPPYTWTLSGGALPAGLTLAPSGQITGSATTVGVSTFTVSATDSTGKTATQQFSINVTPPPPLGPAGCPKIGGQPNSVSASMSGPAIGGRTPSGQAVLDESRVTTCGGYSILNASINGVNLPSGTPMWFYFDSRLVGEVALVNGSAKMPPYNLGDYLSRKDAVSVYRTPPPTTLQTALLTSNFLQ